MPAKKKENTPQTESNPEMDAMRNSVEETHSEVPENMPPQTESDEMPEDMPSIENPAIGQTDPEPPPDETMTCMDPDPDTEKSDSLQTDPEPSPDVAMTCMNPDPKNPVDFQTEPEKMKNPRRQTKIESEPPQSDDPPEEKPTASSQRPTLSRQRTRVVPIDERRTVETETDKDNNDLLDLLESLRSNRILTDSLQGVERLSSDVHQYIAVLHHGSFRVIIPVEEAVEPPRDYRGMDPGTVLQYLVNKRLGAEVDYVVKGIDQKSGVVAASRLEAMRMKRRQYYFGTDRDGNNLLYEGVCAEARVVSVIRAGIFVDLFGIETYIPLSELSYQRMLDAAQVYQPGQRVLVKITELDRSDRDHISVTASVKQARENPCEKAFRMYSVNNCYVGTVTVVDTTGVFVALDGGIDCLCRYPNRGRPPRGARVTVRILGADRKSNRLWGVITHSAALR